jgi:hypothetical protein
MPRLSAADRVLMAVVGIAVFGAIVSISLAGVSL